MNVGGGLGKEVVGGMACGWKELEWLWGLVLLVCVCLEDRMDVVFVGMGWREWVCVVQGFWEVGWLEVDGVWNEGVVWKGT